MPHREDRKKPFEVTEIALDSGKLYFYREFNYWVTLPKRQVNVVKEFMADRRTRKLIKKNHLILENSGQKLLLLKIEVNWKDIHPVRLETHKRNAEIELAEYFDSGGLLERKKAYAPGFEFFGEIKEKVVEEKKIEPTEFKDTYGTGLVYEF